MLRLVPLAATEAQLQAAPAQSLAVQVAAVDSDSSEVEAISAAPVAAGGEVAAPPAGGAAALDIIAMPELSGLIHTAVTSRRSGSGDSDKAYVLGFTDRVQQLCMLFSKMVEDRAADAEPSHVMDSYLARLSQLLQASRAIIEVNAGWFRLAFNAF
jgi:hypothetical protein